MRLTHASTANISFVAQADWASNDAIDAASMRQSNGRAKMKATPETARTIDLGYEQMLVLDGGRGQQVRVIYGGAWLTEEGLPNDAILRAGEQVALRGRGKALLEGLAPSRVQILESAPGNALRRAVQFVQYVVDGTRRIFERLPPARAAAEPNG
jgi:hypothetical protein